VSPTQLREPGTQGLEAFSSADFSPVAQVQSVWTDSPFVVEELHRSEREQILKSFFEAPELQYHGPLEHLDNPLIAVYTGVAGAGKTQFLAQIRKASVTATTRFMLVDMTGVNKFQSTVCLYMVQSLLERGCGRETQLQAVLARLCEISHSLKSQDAGWKYLNNASARDFDALAESVVDGLRAQVQGPPGFLAVNNRKHVLRALMMLCFLQDERSDAAFSWLQGVELERQDAESLRLPRVQPLDIIKSISWLTGFHGRTILAFDQLDVIVNQFDTASRGGDSETAAAAKAVILEITGGLAGLWEQLYRTQILVSCLEQTWSVLRNNIMPGIMSRFVPDPVHLGEIPNTKIAEQIVTLRLRQAYGDFNRPYPTYPFRDDFFEPGTTPRTLLQRCALHQQECKRRGKMSEIGRRGDNVVSSPPPPPTDHLSEELIQICSVTNVDSLLQDADSAEEELGELLVSACELLLLQDPPPENIQAKLGLERERSKKARTALHSRLCLIMLNESDREELFCFRAIQRMHANAFQSRLKAAITDSGINLELPFRRLVIVRTQPVPTGAKTTELLVELKKNRGQILSIEASELRTIQALITIKKKLDPDFQSWLSARRPLAGLSFIQSAFRDYFSLIRPLTDEHVPRQVPKLARLDGGSKEPKRPTVAAKPSILIGRPVGPLDQRMVELPISALTRHVLIRAGSGGGKTVLLKRLVEAAAIEGVPSIVLDPGNDLAFLGDQWPSPPDAWLPDDPARSRRYQQSTNVTVWTPGRMSGRPLAFSPLPAFSEVAEDPDEFEAAVQMAAASLYGPTGASKGTSAKIKEGLLAEAIRYFARRGGKTLTELVAFLRDLPVEAQAGIAKAGKLASDMADTLQGSLLGSRTLLPDSHGADLAQLLGLELARTQISVISLAGLSEANDERLMFVNQLAVALFTWIRKHPAAEAGRVRGLLVVDEAKDFIPSVRSTPCKDSLMRLAAQARKYGFGLLMATQNPTDIDHKAAGQCATQFFGRAASPNVVDALREAIEERGGQARDLTQMEKGQFYFWSAESQKNPVKIQVPICLSHHPDGQTLSESEILIRARKDQSIAAKQS
jgi:DNA helicase HerA-like ATPase